MKFKGFLLQLLPALAVLSLSVACNKANDDDKSSAVTYTEEDQALMKTWVDDVVIATYKDLGTKTLALQTALETLRDSPSQANFTAAKTAWLASRVPWEQSEGFLSGPVDSLGLDPAMDSWPIKPEDITKTVAKVSGNAIVDVSVLDDDVKGFHAIEYLLFGEAGGKAYASQTTEERSYLVSLATDVHKNVGTLVDLWVDSFDGGDSYRTLFLNSGVKDPAPYVTTSAAIDHIVERMAHIAEEVGATKIAGPHDKPTESAIESEYSDNSIVDFQDNVRSILHAYEGSLTGTAAASSVSARVKAKDAALDTEVSTAIKDVIATIGEIPQPFRTSSIDTAASAKIEAAVTKLSALFDLLSVKVAASVK